MLARFADWLRSFRGALTMAVIGLVLVASSLSTGSDMVWVDVAFVVLWVWLAKRALNNQLQPGEVEVTLTQEQKDKIKGAADNLAAMIQEVEAECRAEVLANRLKAKEKGDVQPDKRKDKEAGTKGDD